MKCRPACHWVGPADFILEVTAHSGGGRGARVLVYPGEHPSAVEESGAGVGWRDRILETQTRRQGITQGSLDAFLFSEK